MRSGPKARATVDLVDEWGIYDPAKAGLEALFLKLGLTPEPAERPARAGRRRRRARRVTDEAEGVCTAIEEARRRAAAMNLPPAVPAVAAVVSPSVALVATAPAPVAAVLDPPTRGMPVGVVPEPGAAAAKPRKRPARAAAGTARKPRSRTEREPPAVTSAVAGQAAPVAKRPRKASAQPAPVVVIPATAVEPAPAVAATVVPTPAPAPRSRRPGPLAAWARNAKDVVYAPVARPGLRPEVRVSWRSLLAIPVEVASIEYARGCRIRRIVIAERED